MNEAIIYNWNNVVAAEDTVYVLGDLSMGEVSNAIPLIKRLNGHIVLIRGNHDNAKRMAAYRELGIEIRDISYLNYKGRFFVMCHFPLPPEMGRMVTHDNSEVVMLYGHVHGKAPKGFVDGGYHVGLDTNNLTPISLEQVWKECWTDELMKNSEVHSYYEERKDDKE